MVESSRNQEEDPCPWCSAAPPPPFSDPAGPGPVRDPPSPPPSGDNSRSQLTKQGQSTSEKDEDFCGGVFNKSLRHLHTSLWKQHIRKLKLAFQRLPS